MGTNFPTALDVLTNPISTDNLGSTAVPHSDQHANANDAIEALEAKVGITNSAVATSLDKRVAVLESGGSAGVFPTGIEIGKASGVGIKVDTVTPTFGWRDATAAFHTRATGGQVPSFTPYNGTTVYQYQFAVATLQEIFIEFHIPHDYVPGTEVFIHTHWSQTTVDAGGIAGVPGQVKWNYDALYSKGHQQQSFPATVTTVSALQTASSTVRQHMIAEVQLTSGGAIGGNTLEVDGVILVRMWRDPADLQDTLNIAPFPHFCDMHYQSTNMATKEKAPNFYV